MGEGDGDDNNNNNNNLGRRDQLPLSKRRLRNEIEVGKKSDRTKIRGSRGEAAETGLERQSEAGRAGAETGRWITRQS